MILRFLVTIALIISFPVWAQQTQNDDDVKTLGEIFNPNIDEDNDGKPATATVMGNRYYQTCMNEETFTLRDDEKEILCACSAANMSEHLSVEEFKQLDKETTAGRNARGKAIAYGYTPCINYMLENKTKRDCLSSATLDNILTKKGKKRICKCTSEHYLNFFSKEGSNIMLQEILYEPLTLNPLEPVSYTHLTLPTIYSV